MNGDTEIGGPHAAFPETQLSAVRAAADGSPEARQAALARLVDGYWKPVYKHIRRKWNVHVQCDRERLHRDRNTGGGHGDHAHRHGHSEPEPHMRGC